MNPATAERCWPATLMQIINWSFKKPISAALADIALVDVLEEST